MRFGLYLSTHSRDIWRSQYINYKELKNIVKHVLNAPYAVYVPTQLSFSAGSASSSGTTVARLGGQGPRPAPDRNDPTPQELFFITLEKEVHRINVFIKNLAAHLRTTLSELQASISHADLSDTAVKEALMERAREVSNEYLHLEKFVNLNYAALQKILKKHDKLVPNAPCSRFYMAHISGQPWVRGDHHDLQVTLTRIFSLFHQAHGTIDLSLLEHNQEEHTQRFWVKPENLTQVKHTILQHLPASDVPQGDDDEDDWAIVNHLVLDNSSLEMYHSLLYGRPYCTVIQLRWRGLGNPESVQVQRKTYREGWRPEVSVKDSFPLREDRVADFLQGRWTFADARKYLIQQQQEEQQHELHQQLFGNGSQLDAQDTVQATPSQTEAERLAVEYNLFRIFTEVQRLVESKALQPMVRMVHRETVFEEAKVPGLAGRFKVEIHEDVEVVLEYSYDGMYRLANGLWRQEAPADRILLPYSLINVHTSVGGKPMWLQELIDSNMLIEVHDFSKMLFGVAGLMPDMVRAVPVWIDDTNIQKALYANVLEQSIADAGELLAQESVVSAAVEWMDDAAASAAPLASPQPNYDRLASHVSEAKPVNVASSSLANAQSARTTTNLNLTFFGLGGWQAKLAERARGQGNVYQAQVVFEEPDQYMQNERMLLMWLRLAITVGGMAVMMLGFAAKSHSDPTELPSIHISELTAFVLLFCAICICSYGIGVFVWRGSHEYLLRRQGYDHTVGTLWLNLVLVIALLSLFLVNIADLVEQLKDDSDDAEGT